MFLLNNRKLLKRIDWLLILNTAAIIIFSVIAVSSTTSVLTAEELSIFDIAAYIDTDYAYLQLVFYGVALVAVAVVLFIDYNNLKDFTEAAYWISVALLVAVLFFGDEKNGTNGWFMIGSRGFQPAEFSKLVIIVVLAKETARAAEKNGGLSTVKSILPILWRFAIPFGLILAQPDLGSAFVYFFIMAGILFAGKLNWKIIAVVLAAVAVAIPVAWHFMADYQKDRFLIFLDPYTDPLGKGLQTIRARTVIGAGGFFGKGLFSPELFTQQSNYLPEKHTDFLFASMVEACGFIGGFILILLYLFLILRILRIGYRAKDDFGRFICVGVAFMLIFHVVENIGMNIGVLPITGVPLPLFSYGGSNVLTTMLGIGLVLDVDMRRQSWELS